MRHLTKFIAQSSSINKLKGVESKFKPGKCDFFQDKAFVLGQIISQQGVESWVSISMIKRFKLSRYWPQLTSASETRNFSSD